MSRKIPEDKLQAVEAAERGLSEARDHLEKARAERVDDEVTASLRDELGAIKTDCQPYLGVLVPSDIGTALRAQLRMVENPGWIEALNRLRDVLASNDLHPDVGFEPEEVLGWTDAWLRAQESMPQTDLPPPVPASDHQATAELRLELDAEITCLVRHDRALARIDRAERDAARSVLRVQRLRTQLAERADGPAPTTAAEVLAIVEPVAEQVIDDVGGSLPVAVVGQLENLPGPEVQLLMESLERLADRVQIVVVSTNPAIGEWAGRVGLERADLRSGSGLTI